MGKIRQPNFSISIQTTYGLKLRGFSHLFNCDVKSLKKLHSWLGRIIEWKEQKQ